MDLSPTALVLLGLLLAAWTFGAAWLALAAQSRARQARNARQRAAAGADDRRFARRCRCWCAPTARSRRPSGSPRGSGSRPCPSYLSELDAGDAGLVPGRAGRPDAKAVRTTQKTAAPFRMVVTPARLGPQPRAARPPGRSRRSRRAERRWCGGSTSPKARASWRGCAPRPRARKAISPRSSA